MGPWIIGGYAGAYYGMGPGMMCAYGRGYGTAALPNLTDEHRTKTDKIENDACTKQWERQAARRASRPVYSKA